MAKKRIHSLDPAFLQGILIGDYWAIIDKEGLEEAVKLNLAELLTNAVETVNDLPGTALPNAIRYVKEIGFYIFENNAWEQLPGTGGTISSSNLKAVNERFTLSPKAANEEFTVTLLNTIAPETHVLAVHNDGYVTVLHPGENENFNIADPTNPKDVKLKYGFPIEQGDTVEIFYYTTTLETPAALLDVSISDKNATVNTDNSATLAFRVTNNDTDNAVNVSIDVEINGQHIFRNVDIGAGGYYNFSGTTDTLPVGTHTANISINSGEESDTIPDIVITTPTAQISWGPDLVGIREYSWGVSFSVLAFNPSIVTGYETIHFILNDDWQTDQPKQFAVEPLGEGSKVCTSPYFGNLGIGTHTIKAYREDETTLISTGSFTINATGPTELALRGAPFLAMYKSANPYALYHQYYDPTPSGIGCVQYSGVLHDMRGIMAFDTSQVTGATAVTLEFDIHSGMLFTAELSDLILRRSNLAELDTNITQAFTGMGADDLIGSISLTDNKVSIVLNADGIYDVNNLDYMPFILWINPSKYVQFPFSLNLHESMKLKITY